MANIIKVIHTFTTEALMKTIIEFNNENPPTGTHKWKIGCAAIDEFKQRQNKEDYYTPLLEDLRKLGVRAPEVLHMYILLYLGFDIPRKSFCKQRGHVAPFKFICDVFFEDTRMALAFANRNGGKTLAIAILNHLDMVFKGNCEIVSAGAIKDQANKAYNYFVGFHNDNEVLKDLLAKPPTLSYSLYTNKSSLQVITGSMAAMNGPHPNKARIDEVELMDWDVLQQGFSMARTSPDPISGRISEAQIVLSSTRKYDTGTMQRLLDMAKEQQKTRRKGAMQIYEWCAWEILQKCVRKCKGDSYYGDCPIHDICKGRAHNCEGFYYIDDFIDKTVLLDKDTLDAEWFNLRPSREILVYGSYWREKVHYIEPKEFHGRHIEYVGGIDFGSSPGHPFVYSLYAADCTKFKQAVEELEYDDDIIRVKIIFHLIYEYRSGSNTIEGHAQKIKESPKWKPDLPIFADPSAKQERIDLEETHGISTYNAINAIESGINSVRSQLEIGAGMKSHYYVFKGYLDCDNNELIGTHEEFNKYKYKRFKDGKPNRKEPEQVNDHGMDTARYVIASSIPYFREKFMPLFEEIEEDGYWFERR